MMLLNRRMTPVLLAVCASVMGLAMYAGATVTSYSTSYSDGPVISAGASLETDSLVTMARKQ